MPYAWIITKDHDADPDGPEGTPAHARGVTGPAAAPDDLLLGLRAGEGMPFRLLTGDGEVAYSGRYLSDEDPRAETEDAFGPPDDFGTPNYGCSEIRYLRGGKWEPL